MENDDDDDSCSDELQTLTNPASPHCARGRSPSRSEARASSTVTENCLVLIAFYSTMTVLYVLQAVTLPPHWFGLCSRDVDLSVRL